MNFLEYGTVYSNANLRKYNTYRVESICDTLIEVSNQELLIKLVKKLIKNKIKYIILGNGSNVILEKEHYDEVFIINKVANYEIKDLVYVTSGYMIGQFINELFLSNIGGLEWASGIPGTIGGMIYNNAGAYKEEISSFIERVHVLNLETLEEEFISRDDCLFKYRSSLFKENRKYLILGAYLKLKEVDPVEAKALINDRLRRRIESQPLEYPSAGSTFRNPDGDFAGRLIEASNLKNCHVNDAYVSDKHANFIINKEHASGNDITNLIDIIKNKVYEDSQVELHLEQEII